MKQNTQHNGLIWAAVAGLVLAIAILTSSIGQRAEMLTDNGDTRRAVEESLQRLLPEQIISAHDEALLNAAHTLTGAPYVARVWVVDDSGRIVFHQGGPGKVGDEVRSLSGQNGRSLIAALSSDNFSGPQALQVYTAMALMVEGDHNDVFRPIVKPLNNAQGHMTAMVGLSYDVNPAVSAPAAAEILRMALLLLGLAVYWFCLPVWTYQDARMRGEPAQLWAVFVLIANLVGLVAYLIVVSRMKQVERL